MNFYKRQIKISDFQKVEDNGQPNIEFLLDEKISFTIFLTQNIEDIGFYESDEQKKGFITNDLNIIKF
jgi:hypothetical protein